jgi:hypothetical protein
MYRSVFCWLFDGAVQLDNTITASPTDRADCMQRLAVLIELIIL